MIRLVEREASAAKNVFVIGLDEFNLQHHLRPLAELDNLVIHPLLSYDEVKAVERYDVEGSVQRAREQLRSFPGWRRAFRTSPPTSRRHASRSGC